MIFFHLFLQTPVGKSMDLGSRYFGTFVNFKDFPTSVGKFVQNHKIVILDRSRMIALGYVVCRCSEAFSSFMFGSRADEGSGDTGEGRVQKRSAHFCSEVCARRQARWNRATSLLPRVPRFASKRSQRRGRRHQTPPGAGDTATGRTALFVLPLE